MGFLNQGEELSLTSALLSISKIVQVHTVLENLIFLFFSNTCNTLQNLTSRCKELTCSLFYVLEPLLAFTKRNTQKTPNEQNNNTKSDYSQCILLVVNELH